MDNTPFIKGDINTVINLIKSSNDINKQYGQFKMPLLHYSVIESDDGAMRYLIESGANVNSCDHDGCTPLLYACEAANFEMVKYLVDSGANLDASDKYDYTSLHYAARSSLDIVKYLLEHGANKDHQNKYGSTARNIAINHGCHDIVMYIDSFELMPVKGVYG